MSKRDYLKYLGFHAALLQQSLKDLKPPPMILPQETIDKIKANAKAYMHTEIKSMVGDDELQPHHLQYAHEAGATEWAGKVQPIIDALEAFTSFLEVDIREEYLISKIPNYSKHKTALAKYKEVSNG